MTLDTGFGGRRCLLERLLEVFQHLNEAVLVL